MERVSVEWNFGDIINYFKSLDFNKKNLVLKISSSAVGKMYVTCALDMLVFVVMDSPHQTNLMFLLQKLETIFTKSAKQVVQKLNSTFPLQN